jgi:hypothetical protein
MFEPSTTWLLEAPIVFRSPVLQAAESEFKPAAKIIQKTSRRSK